MPDSKMQTYLLLRLEHLICELRRQGRLSRNSSGPILKWIDERLSRDHSPVFRGPRTPPLGRRRSSQSSEKDP